MNQGAYYAEHSKHQKRFAKDFLHNLEIEPGSHYLDVGCGDGKITSDVTSKHDLVALGTDRSDSMIAYANKHFRADNLSFIEAGQYLQVLNSTLQLSADST